MTDRSSRIVSHDQVDEAYLESRRLKPSAGWILLWAMGVGAVISGDFFGWNLGIRESGFGGLLVATGLMAVMYFCMVYTVAELSSALPHAGGFFSFARSAMGPLGGFVCGLTDVIEYVITPAVIVIGVGGYLNELIFPGVETVAVGWSILWWILAYAIFVLINIAGVSISLRIGLVFAGLAALVLVVFYVSAIVSGSFDIKRLFDIVPKEGHSEWFPQGIRGTFLAIPFAIWFYLAIEQLPLAAEESHNVVRDMPRALVWGMFTLFVLSLLTLIINTGVVGAARLGDSEAPLAEGFVAVFGLGGTAKVLTLMALVGLIASFHAIIYAYARVLFALSRAGYIPRVLSLTGKNHTPYVALIVGALLGLSCTLAIQFTKSVDGSNSEVGAALLNMAVFGAVISYASVMLSYILLRIHRPELKRPYRSPLGIPGAATGLVLSLIALAATMADRAMIPAIVGVAIFLVAGLVYFFAYSRHHLVAQAPEEEVALITDAEQELA
jgi:ethanolamine permease